MRLPKLLVVFLSWIFFACGSAGIGTAADDPAVQAKRLAEIEQLAAVLEKDPRPGIAFDKVYAFHTDQGTLDQLRETYLGRAAAATGVDGASFWIIVGLIDLQRGHAPQAIAAFTCAEKIAPDNFMTSFLLGQSQLQAFQSTPAARSLERALLKQASPTDLKEAFQFLGRIYRRSHQNEKALDLGKRMEALFPGDVRVTEQIAMTLVEENSLELALPRFQELGRITDDKQRQIHFLIEAADIKSRLGQSAAALADFDGLLNQLNPDDASFREIRRRIEAMYMTRDDRIGLVKYYERRVEEHPADWDAVIRLARRLMEVGRGHEAQEHLERGLIRTPTNNHLRQVMISLLLRRDKYSEAMTHYAEMEKYDPGNAELIRDWGKAILNGPADEPDQQKQLAAAIWRKLLTARPNDAATAAFVADLFRQARMHDDALALYRHAIEIAPDTVTYYEQLGECQMQLNQTREALATWREMTAGNRRTAANLSRLSEILSRQELLPEAIEAIRGACEVDQKDFTLHLKYVDLLMRTNRAKEALAQLTILEKLVVTEEQRDHWIDRDLQVQKELGRLPQRIVEVQKSLERSPPDDPIQESERWYWLARAQEKEGQFAIAIVSIRRALKLNPDSIPILIATARVNESHQNLNVAIEFYTRLTKAHRRSRSDYLKRIVALEEKLGQTDRAIEVGRELLEGASADPEIIDFVAESCFRSNRSAEGILILRRSLRTNPDNRMLLTHLASALRSFHDSNEATELLWQALDSCTTVSGLQSVVSHLTSEYRERKELRKLFLRLEHDRRDPVRYRETTICLARAYEVTGNLQTAQQKLEALLTPDSNDAEVLQQLRRLAVRQRQPKSAIRFQRQLFLATGNPVDRSHLVELLLGEGEVEEAANLMTNTSGVSALKPSVLTQIDAQSSRDSNRVILQIEKLLLQFPENWELLYRRGAILSQRSPEKSIASFKSLLRLKTSPDEASVLPRPPFGSLDAASDRRFPDVARLNELNVMQTSFINPELSWSPRDYGQARMAAIYGLTNLQRFTSERTSATDLIPQLATRQDFIDRYCAFRTDNERQVALAQELMQLFPDDAEMKLLFLMAVQNRWAGRTQKMNLLDPLPPLNKERLDEVVRRYNEIAHLPGIAPQNIHRLRHVVRELALAKRQVEAKELFEDALAKATTAAEIGLLFSVHDRLRRPEFDSDDPSAEPKVVIRMLDRMCELFDPDSAASAIGSTDHGQLTALFNQRLYFFLAPVLKQCSLSETMEIWSRYLRLESRQPMRFPSYPGIATAQNPGAVLPSSMEPPAAGRDVTGQQLVQMKAGTVRNFPGLILNVDGVTLLNIIRSRGDVTQKNELLSQFRRIVEAAETSVEERLYWQHSLAYLLFNSDQKDEAFSLLETASREHPKLLELKMGLLRQYQSMDLPSKALTILDEVIKSEGGHDELETTAVILAVAANQLDRAKLAVERLVENERTSHGSSDTSEIAKLMEKAELYSHITRYMNYVSAKRPLTIQEIAVVMRAQVKLGLLAEATASANQALDLTEQKWVAQLVDVKKLRTQCFSTLEATGTLSRMIEDAEAELTTSAEKKLIQKLIEMYSIVKNQPRIDVLELQMLNNEIAEPGVRFQLAMKYLDLAQPEKGFEQIQILLKTEPYLLAGFINGSLTSVPGREMLAAYVTDLEWPQMEKLTPLLSDIIQRLRSAPATEAAADRMFLKVWNSHPKQQFALLKRLANDQHWWDLPLVRSTWVSGLIPKSDEEIARQWDLYGQTIRYTNSEGLDTVLNRLLTICTTEATLDAFAKEVERGIQQRPDWSAGIILLGMMKLRAGDIDDAVDLLEKQPIPEPASQNPMVAWEIAQELSRYELTLDLAATYFKIPMARYGATSASAESLLNAYLKFHRTSDARNMLLEFVPETFRTLVTLPSKAEVSEGIAIGKRLQNLEYLPDAMDVFLLIQPFAGVYRNDLELSMARVITSFTPEMFVEFLEELDGKRRQFSIYLFTREGKHSDQIQSRWDFVLEAVAKNAELTARANRALQLLAEVQVHSIDLHIARARLLQLADGDPKQGAEYLAKYLDQHPLRLLPEVIQDVKNIERLARPAQSNQAAVWLVARDCLKHSDSYNIGEKLGRCAVEFTIRDQTPAMTRAILLDWTRSALQSDNAEKVDQLLKSDVSKGHRAAILDLWLWFAIDNRDEAAIKRLTDEIERIGTGS